MRLAHHGAKGIHHHEARADRRDLLADFLEDRVQILLQHHVGQVDEADRLAQLGFVEERILLLIAQHLHRGLAEDGEVERGFLRRGVGENDLVRQRRLAAARRARDDVEGKFRDAAAEDVVEPAHAGRHFADDDLSRLTGDFRGRLGLRCGFRLLHE